MNILVQTTTEAALGIVPTNPEFREGDARRYGAIGEGASVFPCGKHRGEDIKDVPTDYLEWFVTNIDPPAVGDKNRPAFMDFVSAIEDEISSRKKYGRQP